MNPSEDLPRAVWRNRLADDRDDGQQSIAMKRGRQKAVTLESMKGTKMAGLNTIKNTPMLNDMMLPLKTGQNTLL